MDYVYVWVCDDPQCPYKGFDEFDADNHSISKNHTITKCKNCNYVEEQTNQQYSDYSHLGTNFGRVPHA